MPISATARRREKKTVARSSFLPVALLAALASPALFATTIVPIPTGELAARADAIVHGVVVSTAVESDADGRPETVSVIAPLEVVKGSVPEALVLRQAGGRLPDGTFFQLWGRPEYEPGREVVVFAIERPDGGWQTAELLLGKFTVEADEEGALFAVPDAAMPRPGVTIRLPERADGHEASEATPFDSPRRLAAFLEFVRSPEGAEPPAGAPPAGRLRPVTHPEFEGVTPFWGNIGSLWRWTNGASAQWKLDGAANVTGGGSAEAQNATSTWDNEPNSTINYTISSTGPNPIHLNALSSPCGWSTCLSGGGVIGCGGPAGGGTHTWRGESWATITSGEVWLRSYCSANGFDSITTQAVLTHELGHTLGLGHADTDASPHDVCRGDESLAQMRSSVQHRTTLGTDDSDAVRWLYGDGANSCSASDRTLSVAKTGGGAGTVTSSPSGIDCGGTCSATFADATTVTLVATPAAGSKFSGWSGAADCADGTVQLTSDLSCTATFDRLPDLTVSGLSAPASAAPATSVSVTDTTANAAGSLAAGSSTTALYLSANATWEATDVLLGSRAVASLAGGASSSASTTITIPAGTASGTWYIVARADSSGLVAESDEADNVQAVTIQIGSASPPPPASISFVKVVGTKSASGFNSTMTVAVPAAGVAAGDTLVVALQVGSNSTLSSINCSDPVNGSYAKDLGAGGGGRPFVAVLSRRASGALAPGQLVTCTYTNHGNVSRMSVNEFSGLASPALDRTARKSGTVTGLQTSGLTATTTQLKELVFGVAYTPGGFTPATSNSVEGTYAPGYAAGGSVTALRTYYRVPALPALRSYELNGTIPGSGAWSLLVVTYKGT
jgi:hypothetical protein